MEKQNYLLVFIVLILVLSSSCNDLFEKDKYNYGYDTNCTWFSNFNDSTFRTYQNYDGIYYKHILSDIIIGPDSNQLVYLKTNYQENYTAIYTSILVEDDITKQKKYVNSTAILDDKGLLKSISYDKYDLIFNYKAKKTVSMCLIDTFKIISLIKDVKTEIDFTNIKESVLHTYNTTNDSKFWQDLILTDSIIKIFSNEIINKIPKSSNYLKSLVHYINSIELLKESIPIPGINLNNQIKAKLFFDGSDHAARFYTREPIEKAEKTFFFSVKTNNIYKTNQEFFSNIEYAGIDYMRKPKSKFSIQMGINVCDTLKNPCDPFYNSWCSIPPYSINENDYSTETKTYILKVDLSNKDKYKYSSWLMVDRFKIFGEVKTISIY